MAAYLITGNPGSGKTALAQELVRRGQATLDADDDAELSYWEDAAGERVAGVAQPDREWLASHRWVWRRSRLEQLLSRQDGAVFVCGIARNLEQVLDLFDRVFLLAIDETTQESRLLAYDRSQPVGRTEPGRQAIRDGRAQFQRQMLSLGAVPLDGAAPTAAMADRLLALVAGP